MIQKITTIPLLLHPGLWCVHPYPNHPHGCPNFDKKVGCPPHAPRITQWTDIYDHAYVIYINFPIGCFAKRMQRKYPKWTDRQCYNCRLWQPSARKHLRLEEQHAIQKYNLKHVVTNPEAQGVNVTALMTSIGIVLEWPPRKITRCVSLGFK